MLILELCSLGMLDSTSRYCCPATCSKCGGTGCDYAGGCCTSTIISSGRACNTPEDISCKIGGNIAELYKKCKHKILNHYFANRNLFLAFFLDQCSIMFRQSCMIVCTSCWSPQKIQSYLLFSKKILKFCG